MRLPSPLRAFLAASAFFTLLCLGTEAVCASLLHWGAPYNYPGLKAFYGKEGALVRFVDFHTFFGKFHFFHSRLFYTESAVLPYPAPAVAAYKLFLMPLPTPHHGAWALARYEGSILLCSWVMLFLWRAALVRKGQRPLSATLFVLGCYLFSFAFWFEFAQGNIEWVVWAVLSLGLWAFCGRHFKAAALLIGLAGSMKIFPIIFVGLFLPIRRYRDALLTLLSAAASTVVGLWLVCPDIAYSWHHTVGALTNFEHESVAGFRPLELGFDHSLRSLVSLTLTSFGLHDSQAFFGLYLLVVALGGVLLFFTRIRHLPLPNQILSLAIAAIFLPPVSFDYTLLHLYPGLVLLSLLAVQQERTAPGQSIRGLAAALVLLAFLLSPESELIWHGIRYAGQVKALALVALGYVTLRYPFQLTEAPLATGQASLP